MTEFMAKVRIDKLLVECGLAPSRERAQSLIMSGRVLVGNVPATKAGQLVAEDSEIRIKGEGHPYVGRGGLKLEHALNKFGIDVKDKVCIDVGAATGGFTDCLLQHGASKVYAIDVGYGQLAWKLRCDPRVVVMERVNIRNLNPPQPPFDKACPERSRRGGRNCRGGALPPPKLGARRGAPLHCSIVVIDVSFISLTAVFPHIDRLIPKGGTIISLIKPQFEVRKDRVGKGGIVKEPKLHEESIMKVCRAASARNWEGKGVIKSPITGADGNVEFLAWFMK